MINKETLNFLSELKNNNSKEWLDDNRKYYENTKNDILTLTSELIIAVGDIDLSVANANLDPKKCITRLNRDLRFAKDKTPYKTDYYIVMNKNGKNSASAFYFLHIEPGNCFVGGGVYNPQAPELKKIRQEINYFYNDWTTIIESESFKINCSAGIHNSGILNKIPKEYSLPNPAEEYLKMKGFYTMQKITDDKITEHDTFNKIKLCLECTKPLVDFLNRAIENS